MEEHLDSLKPISCSFSFTLRRLQFFAMIQKLFSIYTHPEESHQLHVEVGATHMVCWCTGTEESFTALEFFTFSYDNTEGGFIDVFRELKRRSILLSNTFASEEIVWENASFMCIPNDKFSMATAASYLSLASSLSFQSLAMYEQLPDYTLTYNADSVLYKIVKENLPQASHTHKLYYLLRQNNTTAKSNLHLQFYQKHFVLTATKNGVLHLATVHDFKAPQEVVYHILNTLDKLEMAREETVTFLSGFIDESSALYKEIYFYVNNLQFTQTGKIKDEYPAHYFTTYNLPYS